MLSARSARYSEADSQISDLQKAYSDKHMQAVDAAFEVLMSSPSKSKSSKSSYTYSREDQEEPAREQDTWDESTSPNEKSKRKVWQAGKLLDRCENFKIKNNFQI